LQDQYRPFSFFQEIEFEPWTTRLFMVSFYLRVPYGEDPGGEKRRLIVEYRYLGPK
jgi:hypothetical protein